MPLTSGQWIGGLWGEFAGVKHQRPFGLTSGHSTRSSALAAWDEAGAGRNTRCVAASYHGRWFSFDRKEFETDTAAATRLQLYMEVDL